MIPAALLASGGLGSEVVVAGVYDHVEIWDRATWRDTSRGSGGER